MLLVLLLSLLKGKKEEKKMEIFKKIKEKLGNKIDFYSFCSIAIDYVKIIWSDNVNKGKTNGIDTIWLEKSIKEDKKLLRFVIAHELAHIYLNYLNWLYGSKQPGFAKENEVICDILASLMLGKVFQKPGDDMMEALSKLYPSDIAKFRISIITNVVMKAEQARKRFIGEEEENKEVSNEDQDL